VAASLVRAAAEPAAAAGLAGREARGA